MLIVFIIYYHYDSSELLIPYFAIFFILTIFPVLFLHFEYLKINRKSVLKIDSLNRMLNYTDINGVVHLINFDEINQIEINSSPTFKDQFSSGLVPFGRYHYAKIIIALKEPIYVTCLMIDIVEREMTFLAEGKISHKDRLFASIYFE
jgi:hypothetical protein